MLNLFRKKYLGIDFSDNYLRAKVNKEKTLIDEKINSLNVSVWDSIDDAIKIISYCLSKVPKMKCMDVVLAIPSEIKSEYRNALMKNAANNIENLKSLVLVENVIAAAVGAKSEEIVIMGPGVVAKKLYVFSRDNQTYISLIWAGALVEFIKITKGYNFIDEEDIIDGIKALMQKISVDVPDKFMRIPAMKPFLEQWGDDLTKEVYISIPSLKQYSLGRTIGDFNAVYTKYSDTLILDGLLIIGQGVF